MTTIYSPNELKRGDIVRLETMPYSQKHFYSEDYDYYFPCRTGKVISGGINHTFETIILRDIETGERFDLVDRVGTSGFQTIKRISPL